MNTANIAIIGTGNLGLSIANGLIDAPEIENNTIVATRRNLTSLLPLQEKGIHTTSNNQEAVRNSKLILLGVKPFNLQAIVEEINDALTDEHIIISLATGISLQEISGWLNKPLPVFRAMPNIATDIRESMTCICHQNASETDVEAVNGLFNHLGESLAINEELMEAATVLGACGIAYVLRFIRAMIQGGVQIGFDAKTAGAIVNQTVKGAAELLIQKGLHPESAIDKVTTPKGCTIVGLNEMEHQGFSSSLIRGIVASHDKIVG